MSVEADTNTSSDGRFMRDELDSGHQLRSLLTFLAFNCAIGFLGYYLWLIFPRPKCNDTIRRNHGDGRIREIVKLSDNECGFVDGCGTIDTIHGDRLLVEKHREKQKPVHLAFLDFEKAFDRVPREVIWHALRQHGVPEELVEYSSQMLKGSLGGGCFSNADSRLMLLRKHFNENV